MFALIDKTNSTEGECLYHIANGLNGCAIALAGILVTLVLYFHQCGDYPRAERNSLLTCGLTPSPLLVVPQRFFRALRIAAFAG